MALVDSKSFKGTAGVENDKDKVALAVQKKEK